MIFSCASAAAESSNELVGMPCRRLGYDVGCLELRAKITKRGMTIRAVQSMFLFDTIVTVVFLEPRRDYFLCLILLIVRMQYSVKYFVSRT